MIDTSNGRVPATGADRDDGHVTAASPVQAGPAQASPVQAGPAQANPVRAAATGDAGGDRDEVWRVARAHAPDLAMAALLAPRAVRADLVAVAAFAGDVDRIGLRVHDAALAEIRLQWWRDAIAAATKTPGSRTGSPVADALVAAIHRHWLPVVTFERHLDGRATELYADPLLDEAAFDAHLAEVFGSVFEIAAVVAGRPPEQPSALVSATAQAYGRALAIARVAVALARGRPPFPGMATDGETNAIAAVGDTALHGALVQRRAEARRRLAEAISAWRAASAAERIACLPLCLVEPYLRASESPRHVPRTMLADVTPLTRTWRLWCAATWGRV
jgi:phytoene synthase